jgi:hypothetical protein
MLAGEGAEAGSAAAEPDPEFVDCCLATSPATAGHAVSGVPGGGADEDDEEFAISVVSICCMFAMATASGGATTSPETTGCWNPLTACAIVTSNWSSVKMSLPLSKTVSLSTSSISASSSV